jgi:hypothetical protein
MTKKTVQIELTTDQLALIESALAWTAKTAGKVAEDIEASIPLNHDEKTRNAKKARQYRERVTKFKAVESVVTAALRANGVV